MPALPGIVDAGAISALGRNDALAAVSDGGVIRQWSLTLIPLTVRAK